MMEFSRQSLLLLRARQSIPTRKLSPSRTLVSSATRHHQHTHSSHICRSPNTLRCSQSSHPHLRSPLLAIYCHHQFSTTPAVHLDPTPLSDAAYHTLADTYLQALLESLESLAESAPPSSPTAKLEIEYAQGTLEIKTQQGTYVINKQPPNKQIWLSSPLSGPKRYDWVAAAEGSGGKWTYLRDGGELSELLTQEIGVKVPEEESGEG